MRELLRRGRDRAIPSTVRAHSPRQSVTRRHACSPRTVHCTAAPSGIRWRAWRDRYTPIVRVCRCRRFPHVALRLLLLLLSHTAQILGGGAAICPKNERQAGTPSPCALENARPFPQRATAGSFPAVQIVEIPNGASEGATEATRDPSKRRRLLGRLAQLETLMNGGHRKA